MIPILLLFSVAARADVSRLEQLRSHPERVVGVELLTAGSLDQSVMSRFGHAMLRLVMEDEGAPFSDPVFNFGADLNGDQPDTLRNYRRGLTGGYQVQVTSDSLSTVYLSYAIGQLRPLERTIIPTDPATRARLINLLLDWKTNGNGSYYFVSRNCIGLVEEVLRKTGIVILDPTVIPSDAHESLTWSMISPYPLVATFKPLDTLKIARRLLKFDMKFAWTADERRILSTAPTRTLQQLNQLMVEPRFQTMRQDMSSILATRKDKVDLATLYEINAFPHALYDLCSASSCDRQAIGLSLNSPYFVANLKDQIKANRTAIDELVSILGGGDAEGFRQYAQGNRWVDNFSRVNEVMSAID